MQLLLTSEQMQHIDQRAITRFGIPGLLLMENAGRACAETVVELYGDIHRKRIAIFCGKGNNGGDGFVIARHLANKGAHVLVGLIGRRDDVRGDARTNLRVVEKLAAAKGSGIRLAIIGSPKDLRRYAAADVFVDAIFGTGFSGEVRDKYIDVMKWLNRQNARILAVDIASGVDSSTGTVTNVAVKADATVTMAFPKIGHYIGSGREHTGRLVVADIGIPNVAVSVPSQPCWRVGMDDVAAVLPRRPLRAHKYSVGKVFIIGGSRQFTGAAVMCAQAVLRSGAGAAVVGVPESIRPTLARRLTEAMVTPLPETPMGTLSLSSLEAMQERLAWADVVAIGPGLGRHPQTMEMVRSLVQYCTKPLVVDADALFAIAGFPGLLRKRRAPTILTPHVGELSKLTGESPEITETNRVARTRTHAESLKCTLVLKGAPTVTGIPNGATFINSTGNPGMATVGSGDVLTGVIASIVSQGTTAEVGAWSGVYLHGLAGDLAASRLGVRSVMATDIVRALPAAFKSVER